MIRDIMQVLKLLGIAFSWIKGDAMTEPALTTNQRLCAEVGFRAKWLSDAQLAELMNYCEVEQINRLAQANGYYDMEEQCWIGAQTNQNIKIPATAV
jgi:hypothetical protein